MIGILSDAHGNVEAFDRAIDVLSRHGAKWFIFLGDAVGYFPGSVVLRRLLEKGIETLMGNHEMMLIEGNVTPERESVYKFTQTLDSMRADLFECLRMQPKQISRSILSGELLFVHGSLSDALNGYIYPDTNLAPIAANIMEGTTLFTGHTHHPFVRIERGVRFINVGSCSMPRDDGRYGAACLFNEASGEARILRFNIMEEWKAALARCPDVHPSVSALIARRSLHNLVGDIVE